MAERGGAGREAEAARRGIAVLRRAAELSAKRLDAGPAADAVAEAERLEERLGRGADHAIAVLQGGTGSGKSALFNAITGMDFAEVSWVRPTTGKPAACVWGDGAEDLLDWLGIGRDSWIKRDSVLESHIGAFRGLILVDLPDYDSALDAHRDVADRVLPMADVLIWVTDPQKYADPALHRRLSGARHTHPAGANLVVLNQIDQVPPEQVKLIEEALTASLVEDGLADPLVALASARTGAGVDRIMAELTRHTAHAPAAARRLAADLWRAADRLGEATAAGDAPSNLAQAAEHLREGTAAGHVPADLPAADRVGEAAAAGHAPGGLPQAPGRSGGAAAPGSEPGGLSAAADRVGEAAAAGHAPGGLPQAPGRLGEATAAGRPAWIGAAAHAVTSSLVEICAPAPSVAPPRAPGAEDTRSAASTWVAEAAVHLPEQWCLALGYALGSPANTATRLKDALAGLELPPEPGFWARLFKRKKAAQARRAEWEKRVRARVAPVVERTMAQPTEVLLADRRNLAQLIAEVRAEAATLGLL